MSETPTRFRIELQSMPKLREDTVAKINNLFNAVSLRTAQRDQAHAMKRALAKLVVAGTTLPTDHPFIKEAELRNLSVSELAKLVLSKPEPDGDLELKRQTLLLWLDVATQPSEVENIINQAREYTGAAETAGQVNG